MRLTRQHLLPAALAAAAALASASALPAVTAATAPVAAEHSHGAAYVVRAIQGGLPALVRDLRERGIPVGTRLPLVDGTVARMSPSAARHLAGDPLVAAVTPDARVTLASATTGYDAAGDTNSMFSIGKVVGARDVWKHGVTGKGVDVALIDSGVAPVLGAPTVVNGPDLTPESQNPATAGLDTFGHGTHMAGIIAGRDPSVTDVTKAASDSSDFLGIAPDARVVSVKVADARGATDVSQVIAGIDWVVQHAHDPAMGLNIRVLNLSFGTDSAQAYTIDPLAYAAEQAWLHGIVVVTSAGNSGAASQRMTDPAIDPYVIAVGADDDASTQRMHDDTIPDFSSRGDGVRNPDVVAPGVHVQSLRVPGSFIDTAYGTTGRIGDRFFRGSGTSQATAVVSGAAALLLQQRPALTPDQVKSLLTETARHLPSADPQAQGHGMVSVKQAFEEPTPAATQTWPLSTGTGSLDASRGTDRITSDGLPLVGEQDIMGRPFDSRAMAAAEADGDAWDEGDWNGKTWAGDTWLGKSWADAVWTGTSWDGKSWADGSWTSGTWTSAGWAGEDWLGKAWAGDSWSDDGWSGKAWAATAWS